MLRQVERLPRRIAGYFRHVLRCLTGGSWWRGIALLGGLLTATVLGALFVAWTGLVSVSAHTEHWAVTRWFLGFAMRNAVETQSMGIKPPPLDDRTLVLKGAGHYETGCAACHGAPGKPRSLIVQHMIPSPPYLPDHLEQWDPSELFWIVHNGLKYTAMPAWPAYERKDEVWAMVAFLQRLPTMTPAEYEALAFGPTPAPGDGGSSALLDRLSDPLGPVLADCARCHGAEGLGRGAGAFPKLAGQSETYLLESLRAYASGARKSGVMQPIAAGLDDEVLQRLARHYAQLPADATVPATDEADEAVEYDEAELAQALRLAEHGAAERGVPSCTDCHGPKSGPINPAYPAIAGQYAEYLALQLELFKSGHRGGTDYANVMHSAAQRLTPEQIDQLARYYASQPWEAIERVTEPRD